MADKFLKGWQVVGIFPVEAGAAFTGVKGVDAVSAGGLDGEDGAGPVGPFGGAGAEVGEFAIAPLRFFAARCGFIGMMSDDGGATGGVDEWVKPDAEEVAHVALFFHVAAEVG